MSNEELKILNDRIITIFMLLTNSVWSPVNFTELLKEMDGAILEQMAVIISMRKMEDHIPYHIMGQKKWVKGWEKRS